MAYFFNAATGNTEWREDAPALDPLGNPLDFSTQYQPRDRFDVPTGQVTELPSIAASNAARAVNRDPAAMQRLQDQAETEAMQQRTLDMQIEQDLVHQKAAKIRRQYEEETAGYDAQYQKWIKGQGPRPEYKTMEQWLTEKEGEKWGPLDHALTIASKASAAPIAGLTRLLDAPAALQQDRQPVGYGGRNTASDVMDRQLAGLEDNLKAEKVIQANKEKKDRFEAHSPEVQRILMGIGSDAEPAVTETDLETFREDSGLRKDPTTWRKGIQGEINNAISMGKDILVGTGHSLSGDIDTREANAAQEFGYTSAEQALATGLVSSGVLAGSKAAYKLVRTRMMLRAQRLQLLGKKVEQVEKAAKLEAKKAGKFTEALGGNEQLGIQAKKLSEAMRKDALLIKAMQNGAEMAAEDVIEGTTESMIGSAQGAKSQMSFEGLTGNIVQEKTLDVGGQVLKKLATKLPELNRALKGLPPPPKGVTEAEFIKQVLPKLLKSDPKLLEEAAQHSNIKELGEAIRDMKLQDNSVTISPQEVLSVNPDYSNPETTTNLARLNDLAGKTGAKVRIAEATGYTEGASGRLLGENNGLIRLYGGATGGTLKEEAVHTVQQYLRSSDTMLGKVHDRLAREAERRIKALPANHPLKRELSKAFGRDITESPLTGDELMARALMTNAGIKSASKAEDTLGKIVGVPPELQKVFETMLGKKLRQNKSMKKNKGLLTDEKPYDLTEEGQRRNEETSDFPIVRKNAIQPFVEGAEAPPTEGMKLDEYERQALEEADLRNNPSVAGSSDLDAYEQEQLDYSARQANPTITRRGLDAQEREALKEARLKAFPSTVPKGFDEHLSRIEKNLGPLMRSAGYNIDNLSDVKKYAEEYPSNIASWYQKLREGEKAGTLDPAMDLKEGYAKHVREVSSQREAGHSHQQSFDQDMTQVKPLVKGDNSPTVISLPPAEDLSQNATVVKPPAKNMSPAAKVQASLLMYHGTGADFFTRLAVGKEITDKAGKEGHGEGVNAYGAGLYLTLSKRIGKWYHSQAVERVNRADEGAAIPHDIKKSLNKAVGRAKSLLNMAEDIDKLEIQFKRRPLKEDRYFAEVLEQGGFTKSDLYKSLDPDILLTQQTIDAVKEYLDRELDLIGDVLDAYDPDGNRDFGMSSRIMNDIRSHIKRGGFYNIGGAYARLDTLKEAIIRKVNSKYQADSPMPGQIFTLELDVPQTDLLPWDAIVHDDSVKDKLRSAMKEAGADFSAYKKGEDYYQEIADALHEKGLMPSPSSWERGDMAVSNLLLKHGIIGNYFEAGVSRGSSDTETKTYNFVLYSTDKLHTVRREKYTYKGAITPLEKNELKGKPERFEPNKSRSQFSLSQEGSEEFKKWFGGSKVVDGAGKPLPVFHGTRGLSREDFSVFEGEAVKSNWRQDAPEGFFFTDSPENANQYARGGGKMVEGKFEELSPRVKKVYLALQNPLVIDAGLPSTVEQVKKAGGLVRYISRKKESSKENPIDGVILKNYSDPIKSTTYIAFDPTQIKSATGNKGTFDKTNPDIRASLDTSENPLDMVAQGKDEKTKPKRKATPKAPKSDSLTAKERIVKSIRAMLRGYGSLPETFDIADAIENLNKKNRLKFYAELDQHMDSYRDDFYEVGVNPEQGEGREELIDKLKVWGNKNISNKEEWGTLQLLKDAPNAPFQVPETTTHQAQDLQGDWYIAQELVTIVPTPKGMAVYKDGKKIGQVKKEDMLHVDRIQVKEAPDVDPVQIPDDVYLDNDGDYDPIYSPIEDQELEDFRTYGVGRVSDTPSKKVTVADLNPRSLVTNAKTGAKLLFQPKEQLSPALKAELARPGEDYIGKLKGVGARGKAVDFFKEQMAKLDYFFAQMYRELEKYEKDYPGELKKSAYMGARIMPASVAWQTSKKIDPVMRVITKRLADAGLKWDEAEQYAYAGAALERNQIKRDEDGVENASGISDDEAIAEMKRIANTPEKDKALKRVFGEVDGPRGIFQRVNDSKLDALVEVGLLQKDYAKELKKKYKFYVPMKTLERTPTSLVTLARAHTLNMVASAGLKVLSENETLRFLQKRQEAVIEDAALPPDVALDVETPMDMSVKGHNMRVASGRATPADFPLSWAMRDAVNGIAKSERAKVQQVFLENIMEMGADPRFIEVLPPLVKRWVWAEKSTGKKLTKQQTMDLGLDQQYVRQQKDYKKVEGWFGEDGVEVPGHEVKYENEMIIAHGGRSYKLIANPANQTAMRAIKAMKQSDVYKMGALTKALSALNMWRSSLLTRFNYQFAFTNVPKDFLGALTQTFIRQGAGTTARFLVQWPIALKHALQGKFTRTSTVFNDYKKHGGSIEFMRDSDVEQIMKKYDRQVRMLQAKGLAKVTPRQLFDLSLAALEFLNDVSDKVTRIAVYQAVVKSMPPEMKDSPAEVTKWKQKAALFSREATVDFNAKGVKTPLLSSIFLFGNPGVQAFRTMVGNFTTGDPSVTRRAAVLYSTALMMGVGLTYYNMMQGDDEETGNNRWDDIGAHNKSSKIIILGKKGASIAIPLMYGSTGFFFIMGEVLGSTLFSDKDDAADRVELAMKAVGSSMPIQTGSFAGTPLIEIAMNEDYKKMPIVPEKPFSPYIVPDSEKFYRSTPEILKSLARGLNRMTGAEDDKVSGWFDVSPATLNYWLAYATGSMLNNANQIMRFKEGIEKTTGTEQKIPTQDIPILSKYTVSNPEDRAIRTVYEAENEMQVTKARMRELSNQGKGKEARDFIRENYSDFWMLSAWEGISGTVSSIRSRREKGYIGQADPRTEEKVNQMKLNLARKWNQFKKGKEDFDKRYSEAKTDAEREELRKELRALIKRD